MPKIIYKGTTYASSLNEVPNGGTTGQVLAKASNTDKDIVWKDDEKEWKEIARYTGSVTPSQVSISIPAHNYIRIVINSAQTTSHTSPTVLRVAFNNIWTDTAWDRQGFRYQTGGTMVNIASGTAIGIIADVSTWNGSQGYCEINGSGIGGGGRGWNKFAVRMASDNTDWTNALGWYRLRSLNTITSVQMKSDGAASFTVEAIIYGHD